MNDESFKSLPTFALMLNCNASSVAAVRTARGGMAGGMRVDTNGSGLTVKKLWSTEEEIKSFASENDEF